MPDYSYSAINSNGTRVSGEISASDPDAVVANVTSRGLRIEYVQIVPPGHDRSHEAEFGVRLGSSESRELGGHIAEIVSSGLPMEGGLAAIAEEMPRGRLRRALRGIVRDLEGGADLESVLARRRAPAYLAALVRAGRRSGRTAEILDGFIANSRVVTDLRQTVWMALVYPLALLMVIVPMVLFLFLWVVPAFATIFQDFGLTLPWFTDLLFRLSTFSADAIGTMGNVLLGAVLTLTAVFVLISRAAGGRRIVRGIPILGPFLRWLAFARFSQLLALLIQSRVPLDEALVLAGDAAGDAELRADCKNVAAGVRAGQTLESAARATGRLPPSFIRALSWERHQEAFPEVLESTADMYTGRARVLVALLVAIIPPVIVVLTAVFVGFVVFAVFWPLIDLMKKLSL
jgi:type II secretory pathway component PulF